MKKLFFATISALAIAGVATAADSTEFGAMQVLSKNKSTIVAIPWDNSAAGGGAIVVSNLVLTANLTENDTLDTLKSDGTRLDRWVLTKKDGVLYWQSVKMTGENGSWESANPSSATVARGSAVLLTRKSYVDASGKAVPFFVMGQVASTGGTSTVAKGSAESPIYSLIAPPSVVAQGLNGGDHGATWAGTPNAEDRIYIPGEGGLVTEARYCTPTAGGDACWCEMEEYEVTKFGETVKKTRKVVCNKTIPVGTGVWYLSKGGNPTVTWKDLPEGSK